MTRPLFCGNNRFSKRILANERVNMAKTRDDAFVNLIKGKDGLVHISQLANERVNKVEDVVKLGDEVLVKVTEIDRQGRVNLSRKALLEDDKK